MHNFFGSDLEVCTSRWYRILLFTQDFDFTVVSHSETSLSRLFSRLYAFPGYMQPAIWAMYVVMKLDARGAVMLNELTAVLLSGYILMETISAAVPWGGSLNNACESSGSQWPEAYPPLLLPPWHILSESQVNMSPAGLCYTRLKPPLPDSGFKSRAEQSDKSNHRL